jgi:repressor LexA
MIEDGIFDGDYVFVRKQLQANPGETVVVMIDDEATCKRYYPEGETIRFQPANASMQPIVVRKRDFKSVNILGVVIGVYRKLQ